MKDFYGRPVLIGDNVVFSGMRAPLYRGTVVKLSNKLVYINTGERRRPEEVIVEVPCLTHVEEK